MKRKQISLLSSSEEGYGWSVRIHIGKHGEIGSSYFDLKDAYKRNIREKDRKWVKRNLPCFIGVFERHHDWLHGGILYFLTKEQQLHRKEKAGNLGKG